MKDQADTPALDHPENVADMDANEIKDELTDEDLEAVAAGMNEGKQSIGSRPKS